MRLPVTVAWDRSARRRGPEVIGGVPLRKWKFSEALIPLLDSIDRNAEHSVGSPWLPALRRLVIAGVVHPVSVAPDDAPMSVCVVIPVRDDVEGLGVTLRSVAGFRSGNADLGCVVVDDGSQQGALINAATEKYPWVSVVRLEDSAGPAAARNRGAIEAGTDWILFMDANIAAPKTLLADLVSHARDTAAEVAAPRVKQETRAGLFGSAIAATSSLDLGPDPARVSADSRVSYLPAPCLLIRSAAFRTNGGFDETLSAGEDVDLVWRLESNGVHVRYFADLQVLHGSRTMRAAVTRRFVYGTSAAALAARHPKQVYAFRADTGILLGGALLLTGFRRAAGLLVIGVGLERYQRLQRETTLRPFAGNLARWSTTSEMAAFADALCRPFAPLTAVLVAKRSARIPLVFLIASSATRRVAKRHEPVRLRTVSWQIVDDIVYSAGVWSAALRARDLRALAIRTTRFGSSSSEATN